MAASDQQQSSSPAPTPTMLVPIPTDEEMLQAQAHLWRHTLSYLTPMALRCAINLRIPTAIHRAGGQSTLPDLITSLSLPSSKLPFLRRLMRLLVSSNIFSQSSDSEEDEIVYRLAPISFLLVDGDNNVVDGHISQTPHVLAATSRYCLDTVSGLATWLTTEEEFPISTTPFESAHGVAPEGVGRLDPEMGRLFEEGLRVYDASGFAVVLRECRGVFEGVGSLTDCGGGGEGDRRRVPGDQGRRSDGVVEYVAGDMFEFVPPAQAVMLKLMMHHWSDDDCVKILAQCKKAIPTREEGGKVIIIDIVVGSVSGPMLESQILMDVAVMMVTKGRQRDENDWRDIFMKAGFNDYKIVKKLGPRCLIEVYP
uniref:O-methyltransferase domain-containing protein n=1 Tax=Leersia perrieri TaxID=77586 RepID=A0A0D9XRC9_9ORYZ